MSQKKKYMRVGGGGVHIQIIILRGGYFLLSCSLIPLRLCCCDCCVSACSVLGLMAGDICVPTCSMCFAAQMISWGREVESESFMAFLLQAGWDRNGNRG